ncbi:efflux RND transporter periplasmic adaptor subunit [Candidatus Parcubacteria bacterium]|nr:efflux RND transporter periplasmic adaptor subunit [Candidatus Parcubacteria bacterium]
MSSILEESKKARGIGGFFTLKKIIILIVSIIILSGGYYIFYGGKDSKNETEVKKKEWTAKKGDLQVAIESDGKVVAEDGVELSFSVSGDTLEVKGVFVSEGDIVKKGDKIASVKTDDLEYDLRKAYASYQSALANYNDRIDGATDDEKAKSKASIEQAEISLEQAKISLEKIKLSAKEKIDDAKREVKDAKDDLDKNKNAEESENVIETYEDLVDSIKAINISLTSLLPNSDEIIGVENKNLNDDFENNLGAINISSKSDAEASFMLAKNEKDDLDVYVVALSYNSNYSDIDIATEKTETALDAFEDHFYDMKVMLDYTITSTDLSQSALDAFKSTINSDRTTINTKITSLRNSVQAVTDAKEAISEYQEDYQDVLNDLADMEIEVTQDIKNSESSIDSRELSLKQAKLNYSELTAPLTDSELASVKSSLTSASINVDKARNDLEKAIMTSPIDGEVVMLNYKVGDIILKDSSKSVVEIINNDTLFIEVQIEEADINKIELGQKAYGTFDALDGLKLKGDISFISLTSKTDNNGIVTYLVRIVIEKPEGVQVREGMTAFVDFVIAEAPDVIIIPVASVRNVEGKPSVEAVDGSWIPVVTGFTDGKNVEVISGLEVGDKITY